MDTAFLKPLIAWLHLHPEWGYFFAFIFSFLEGLALVGLIIPGSVVMTVAGILAGSGILPVSYLIFWSAIGAFLGDYLSYGIGYYYRNNLKNIWPFKYFPKLIDQGSEFFRKHGGKSIFSGRFIGPVRPIIPLIAGSLKMPAKRFIPVDLLACILWPPAYMLPGFILGAASLALPPDASTRIIINLVLLLIIVSFAYWLLKLTLSKIIYHIDLAVYKFWQVLKRHPRCAFLYNLLKVTHIPDDHSQLGIALLACATTFLFLITLVCVITHSGIYHFNEPLHYFLRSLYTSTMKKIMLLITFFGNPKGLLFLWLVILIWFSARNNWYSAIHWVAVGILATVSVELLKHLVYSPRPLGLVKIPNGGSFPSGHTTLSSAIYSYLALTIAHDRKRYVHYLCYSLATIIIILISFSRIYLGAHWLSDVIGGILLGLSISLFVALSYRKTHRKHQQLTGFLALILITLLTIWSFNVYKFFSTDVKIFSPTWETKTLTLSKWWETGINNQPLYRQDRLGQNVQTLNIEWLGSVSNIKKQLEKLGWQPKQKSLLLHTIHYFGEKNRSKVLPLFSSVYLGKKPILVLSKFDLTNQKLIILRFWKSQFLIAGTKSQWVLPLLVGAISYHKIEPSYLFTRTKKNHFESTPVPINQLKEALTQNFKNIEWKVLDYPNIKPLTTIEDNGWNGQILLIKDHELK